MSQDRTNFQDAPQGAGFTQGANANANAPGMFRGTQAPVPGMMMNPMGTMLPNSGGSGGDPLQQQNISNEIKRLQQLQNLGGNNQTPSNALLMTGNQRQNDTSAAFLQSMLDQQQKVANPRFEDALRQNMGAQNPMLQPGFLQDARFLMTQNQLNPGMPAPAGMVSQGQPGELPLPSPHSLFHRDGSRRMRGGVIEPFPEKLHRLLMEVEAAGLSDVISFVANGRAFAIHKPDKFFKEIVPLYFRQSRLSSFKRQLNLYGFELINTGPARGGYYHELFVKDRAELCRRMRRVAVKVVSQQSAKAAPEDKEKDVEGDADKEDKKEALGDVLKELAGESPVLSE